MKHSPWKGGEREARALEQSVTPRTSAQPSPAAPGVELAQGDALERYLGEVQGYSLLSSEEEVELAEQVERLELQHWQALLSYAPAVEVLRAELAPALAAELGAARDPVRTDVRRAAERSADPTLGRPAGELARALRALDFTRDGLKQADVAVTATYRDQPAAREYLARMAQARAAQLAVKHRFVNANLRLVLSMARRYERFRVPLADLVQEGNLGLMLAVERFDHRRGVRFSTYAGWWIRHYLNRAVARDSRLVRIPVHARAASQLTQRAQQLSAVKTGAALSDEELAQQTGLSLEKLAFIAEHAAPVHPTSLDQPIGKDRDQTLHDLLARPGEREPEELIGLAQWEAQLPRLLRVLTPVEATILERRFGLRDDEELSLRAIGEQFDLTRERIRQLQNQALEKLRSAVRKLQRGDLEHPAL